jgi:predicted DNA-binding protein (UPF0251 family)
MPDVAENIDHIDCTPKYTPIEVIRELIEIKDLTYEQAGKILGVSKQARQQRCDRHGIVRQALKKYKEQRADILASKGRVILNSLTTDEIKKIPPGSRVTAFGILYDKERLERGESTANVAYADLTKDIHERERKIEELRARLGMSDNTT